MRYHSIADDIEDLTAEKEKLHKNILQWQSKYNKVKAERDRLTAENKKLKGVIAKLIEAGDGLIVGVIWPLDANDREEVWLELHHADWRALKAALDEAKEVVKDG